MKPEIDGDVEVKIGFGSGWVAAFAALPKETRDIIGMVIILMLFLCMFFLFVGGMSLVTKWPEVFGSKCWDLQFKDDRAFKVNTCNGTVVELDKKTLEPKKNP
jgi:hypothetical protein